LAIGPADGDAAAILNEQEGTLMVPFETAVPWPQVLDMCAVKPNRKETLLPYSRAELANKMHQLLETLCS
jgi:hypothetical protein